MCSNLASRSGWGRIWKYGQILSMAGAWYDIQSIFVIVLAVLLLVRAANKPWQNQYLLDRGIETNCCAPNTGHFTIPVVRHYCLARKIIVVMTHIINIDHILLPCVFACIQHRLFCLKAVLNTWWWPVWLQHGFLLVLCSYHAHVFYIARRWSW